MPDPTSLERLARHVQALSASVPLARPVGRVVSVSSTAIVIEGLSHWLKHGSFVEIAAPHGMELAEVLRLERKSAHCKPLDGAAAIGLGLPAYPRGELVFHPHPGWKGRIMDALARPVDGKGPLEPGMQSIRLSATPPRAMARQIVSKGLTTGVRVVDAFVPLCLGQRIGIFAGSGVGKSTLLSMLAQANAFDSVIVALVGERGREVREFVEHTLHRAAGNAITVVSTGDESAMMRRLAPLLATSLAEHFRDEGQNVLLVMDSVTRYAHACREVALSAGEPPVARGYPPSVFSHLPQLLERAGPGAEGTGTITGIYTVLVDGDDHNDPVADTVRGTLDGHIVLDRAIGEQGRYPAVNVLSSLSRLAPRVWTAEQLEMVVNLKRLIARFEETRDLRAMGGYVSGGDPDLDQALKIVPKVYRSLTQALGEAPSINALQEIREALSAGS